MPRPATFFATCAPGVEPFLHRELRALRVGKLERQVGGVRFAGSMEDAWRANLWLRTAIRVLLRLGRFAAPDSDALYRGIRQIDWHQWLRPDGALLVDAQARDSALDHSQFVAQRTKDAIVDQLRARAGVRPSVDKERPDVRVHVHLFRDRATVSLDTSGDSLHKRGWRRYQGFAPLSETGAAALLMMADWDLRSPLLDPFCGSGTILVEAAAMAANAPPGMHRGFAFERWVDHDAKRYAALKKAALAMRRPLGKCVLRGADLDWRHVEGAQQNIAAAGFEGAIEIGRAEARTLAPRRGWNAWIVTNPPFGERVSDRERVGALYRSFGRVLRQRCADYWVGILASRDVLLDALELPNATRHTILHGGLDCRVLCGRVPQSEAAGS